MNALEENWKCRKCKRVGYCPFSGFYCNKEFSIRIEIFWFHVTIVVVVSRQKWVLGSEFRVATEFASVGRISVTTEVFDVAAELAKARRNYVAIETICVATELAAIENFSAHDRAGVRGLGAAKHPGRTQPRHE